MNILQFISSITNSLAWPLLILVIFLLLKKQIQGIFARTSQFSYGDLKVNFSEKLIELESNLKKIGRDSKKKGEHIKTKEEEISAISPIASVILSWTLVEKEITSTTNRLAISADHPSYISALKKLMLLYENKYINRETYTAIKDFSQTRNLAVHGQLTDEELTEFEANKYAQLSNQIIFLLKNIERK